MNRDHAPKIAPGWVVAGVASAALVAIGVAMAGCSQDGTTTTDARSRRGETCTVSADCAEGLACAPVAGVEHGGLCVTANFNVVPTAKECTLVECATSTDCCDPQKIAGCETDREMCQRAGNVGPACDMFAADCGCLTGTIECVATKCVSHCNTDNDCFSLGRGNHCAGGNCAECIIDAHCSGGRACVSGKCQTGCTNDADCGGFDRCLGSRCVASGCQTDRECVASTRNVDAQCGTDGKCIIPCETDLECGSPTDYAFFSCIDKRCTFVGCQTDKDCGFLYFGNAGSSPDGGASTKHAVCKDKSVGVVTPAP